MLVLLDILLDLTGKLHVGGVSRTVGDDMRLDREADQVPDLPQCPAACGGPVHWESAAVCC